MLNMASRGYFGTLSFNHEDRTLDIKVHSSFHFYTILADTTQVKTDDQIAGSYASEKDPVSLSGGEKSFSTICLLLALWDTLGCPIRCLGKNPFSHCRRAPIYVVRIRRIRCLHG